MGTGHVARMEEDIKIIKSNSSGQRILGRPRHRCEDNIRTDLKETGINTRNWVD